MSNIVRIENGAACSSRTGVLCAHYDKDSKPSDPPNKWCKGGKEIYNECQGRFIRFVK